MDFSVVVLTFNSAKYIEKCLTSLADSFAELDKTFEIFVIDNGSTDGSCELAEKFAEERKADVKLIRFGANTGTTFSRNVGLRAAKGEFVIVLDSDAYVNASAIKRVSDYLKENSNCGLAVPKLTYPDGRYQLSTDVFPTITRKIQRAFFLRKLESREAGASEEIETVDYAISAFWMFPRATLEKVGLLDEKIFYAPEDVDFCIRIWKAGLQICYIPDCSIVHDAQELSRKFKVNKFTLLHVIGLLYYFTKHRYVFSASRVYNRYGIR